MLVQKVFSYLFLIFLMGVLAVIWQGVVLPCEKPLLYSLGKFDERFGITQEEFLEEVVASEKLWEDAFGKELFAYSTDAPFKVNLIFDERQLQTLEAKKLSQDLEKTQNTEQSLTEKQNTLLAQYERENKEYQSMLSSFKKQLHAYNAEVEKWNKRGGAPQEEYEELQEIAEALEKSQKRLEEKRQTVNALAEAVNSFSKQKVSVIEEYNERVQDYVARYGEPKEFDQGEYVGTEINIYQFDDQAHLRAVLVHELGHALGLSHGSNPTSIMYPLMEKQMLDPLTLSSEDRNMLLTQCSQNVWDLIFQRIEGLK